MDIHPKKMIELISMKKRKKVLGSSFSMIAVFHAITVLFIQAHVCHSQESPTLLLEMFDDSTPHKYRTNMCERQKELFNGTLQLRDALRNLSLSVYITNSENMTASEAHHWFALSNGTIPTEEVGLTTMVLDELAERAGFTWRNSFGTGRWVNEEENKTWTDVLVWATDHYDVAADIWGRSTFRKSKGISFTENYFDNSIIIVQRNKSKSGSKKLQRRFLEPDLLLILSL